MREIKFRVFDKKYSVLDYDFSDDLLITNDGKVLEKEEQKFAYESWYEYVESDRYVLMQFTGLLDKNGTEIYEGDIIQREYVSLHPSKISDFKGVVVFAEGTYFIENPNDKNECAFLFDEIATNEIIGNIYENPELLGSATS